MSNQRASSSNSSTQAVGAARVEDVNQNHDVKDYGMTIQQSDMQMKVIDRAADCAPLLPIGEVMIGGELEQTINARDLHAFLEVGKDFTTWVKDRITQYDFVDGVDFTIVETLSSPNSGSSKARSQRVKEYYLTLDMAKELSMVERNAKGKQARQYFIQCERMAKSPNSSPMLVASTMNSDQLALLMGEVKRREEVQLERDEAIRTKAFISSSREASVMAKLGHTKRENEALKEQLGVGAKHKSVKGAGLEQFYIDDGGNRRQTANRLKKLALAMGVAGDIIDIEDPNYGTVKAYPVSVIERFKLEVSV